MALSCICTAGAVQLSLLTAVTVTDGESVMCEWHAHAAAGELGLRRMQVSVWRHAAAIVHALLLLALTIIW
jgi:hypothetical protein